MLILRNPLKQENPGESQQFLKHRPLSHFMSIPGTPSQEEMKMQLYTQHLL